MHLSYVDDAGSNEQNRVCLYGGVVVPTPDFISIEALSGIAAFQLFPGRAETLKEFKGRDLFHGVGEFEGISEDVRFKTIEILLMALTHYGLQFIYSAIDRRTLEDSVISTVNPQELTFKLCVIGIEDWAQRRPRHEESPVAVVVQPREFVLLIVDDNETNQEVRELLKASYRKLRSKWHQSLAGLAANRLWHLHDAMYFGDSRDSVGLQIADLCSYFMGVHLAGKLDPKGHRFYDIIKQHAVCAKPYPEWSLYKHLLLDHEVTDEKTKNAEGLSDSSTEA